MEVLDPTAPSPPSAAPAVRPAPPPRSGWEEFDGRPVAIQLRSTWILVDEMYSPVPTDDGKGLRGTTIFRGILRVFPDILLVTVPRPDGEATYTVTVHPDDVEHCTHITLVDKPRIAPP